jgi:hypothetical protein
LQDAANVSQSSGIICLDPFHSPLAGPLLYSLAQLENLISFLAGDYYRDNEQVSSRVLACFINVAVNLFWHLQSTSRFNIPLTFDD